MTALPTTFADALALLARADALMAEAGPLGMAAGEPWEEGDEEYARRLGVRVTSLGPADIDLDEADGALGETLDKWGLRHGLPRARLALVEG